MKSTMKRMLALFLALLLAVPSFAFAEEPVVTSGSVDQVVSSTEVSLGGEEDDGSDDQGGSMPVGEVSNPPADTEQPGENVENADAPGDENADTNGDENADVPGDENADVPGDENADVPGDENADTSVDENTDTSVDENTDTSVDENADTSVDENGDTSVDENADTTVDENSDTSVDENSNTSVDENTDTSVDENTDTSVDENTDTSVDENTDTSVDDNTDADLNDDENADADLTGDDGSDDADLTGDEDPNAPVEEEAAAQPFDQSALVNGVIITVKADAGVFPADAVLSVELVPVEVEQLADEAIEEVRDENANVAVSYTFDIKVINPVTGEEYQPADGQTVNVSFSLEEVADGNLETQVYHVTEDEDADALVAEKLDVAVEDEVTATVETEGFSLYTVEFTYNKLEYVLPGDTSVALGDILTAVGLSGEVTDVEISDTSLFSASDATGEWIVTAHQAFTTTEWMKVTISGVTYEIVVTDALGDQGEEDFVVELYDEQSGDQPYATYSYNENTSVFEEKNGEICFTFPEYTRSSLSGYRPYYWNDQVNEKKYAGQDVSYNLLNISPLPFTIVWEPVCTITQASDITNGTIQLDVTEEISGNQVYFTVNPIITTL